MARPPDNHGASLAVVIHDEDAGGEPLTFRAGPGTPISTIIGDLYRELKTDRKPDDRLTCVANGDDVFAHEHDHLGRYAESVCPALEWAWSGKTGGA